MRPRGRTPRMLSGAAPVARSETDSFNEAAGAYPADAAAPEALTDPRRLLQ